MIQAIRAAIEKNRDRILAAERYIWANPETGYRERKTSAYLAKGFEELGYTLSYADGIPGFYTVVDTGREGPEVLVLGELDSVICPTHPEADPETGAVHACGHNVQCAALLGIAAALRERDVLDGLCGRIRLCAVPAEELLEIEYRSALRAEGKIRYFGGKSEFLARGYFDGVDLAFMVHAGGHFVVQEGMVGCLAKNIIYKGRSAHAGAAPWQGNNALYAATCGLSAVNAIRETFRDSDIIRVHPIITHGGDMVNAIPAEVRLESYVRGKSFEAITAANKRVNRALCGAALSLGVNIEIIDAPGYSPEIEDDGMTAAALEAAALALPDIEIRHCGWNSGSSDMGDLSCIMPTVQLHAGGTRGAGHGADYVIADPEQACLRNAEWQLTLLFVLLREGAARAKAILRDFKPRFASKEEFLDYTASLFDKGDRITYRADGTAEVRAE